MKDNELELLHRYLDGAITPDELESLNGLWRGSAGARATLRSLATIDAKWQQLAADGILREGEAPADLLVKPNAISTNSRRLMPQWQLTSARAA